MSGIRRRATAARKLRDDMRRRDYEEMKRWMDNIAELIRKKGLTKDTTVTVGELAECFEKARYFQESKP